MLFDYLITTLAQKAKKLVSCEYDAFSKNFNFENSENLKNLDFFTGPRAGARFPRAGVRARL